MAQPTKKTVLDAHAALPEAYQPAWGLDESRSKARRACDDRLAYLLEAMASFNGDGPLRVLDIGCAQGYFVFALKHELERKGRIVEVIGVDYLEDNIHFCRMLAEHHGIDAEFIHDGFDAKFFERHGLTDFDFVLALNVLHHVRELDGERAATTALESISRHATVLLCELAQSEEALDWIGNWHDSDSDMLAPFAFRRRLGNFGTHLTEVKRPLYACSNHFAYVAARWFDFEQCNDRAHAGVPDRFAGQRRFFIGREAVIKCYRGEGDYAAFNRAELAAELSALAALCDEPGRYPPVLAHVDDGDLIWLVRGKLPGTLLSELIDAGQIPDGNVLVRALLEELAHLECRGFHHTDLRAWNILWHRGVLRLIDFGSLATKAAPLNRVALAAVLAEMACGKLDHGPVFYCTLHPHEIYPSAWHPLLRYLLGQPQQGFHYLEALAVFDDADGTRQDKQAMPASGNSAVCGDVLGACAHEQHRSFQRLQEHIEDLERRFRDAQGHADDLEQALQKVVDDAEDEGKASKLALDDAAQYAQSLQAKIEHMTHESEVDRQASKLALDDAAQYAQSLRTQIEREGREAEAERDASQVLLAQADVRYLQLKHDHARLRHRFRLLQPFMPKDTHQAKEQE